MKGLLVALLIFLVSMSCGAKQLSAWQATDYECGRYAVWKEARGESLKVRRAVLDTIQHRAAKAGRGLCSVLRKPYQFPYFRYGVKRVDKGWDKEYDVVLAAKPVLSEDYIFFNTMKSPWGTGYRKIGNLWFAK